MAHTAFNAMVCGIVIATAACSASSRSTPTDGTSQSAVDSGVGALADVRSVSVTGDANSYTLSVTLRSPDTGCAQYANWWEVISPTGELIYRRILGHSHVDEQPFSRSGGPVAITADQDVIIRAYMHTGGYGGQAVRGSVNAGFTAAPSITGNFATELATTEPLPTGCAF